MVAAARGDPLTTFANDIWLAEFAGGPNPRPGGDPGDLVLPGQWYLLNDGSISPSAVADVDVDAGEAWDQQIGRMEVIVAIIDSGIVMHPDLVANLFINAAELDATLTGCVPSATCAVGTPTCAAGESYAGDTDGDCLLTYRDLNPPGTFPPIPDADLNGQIDVIDLLPFSAGADDGNGVPDDVTGADFTLVYSTDPMVTPAIDPGRATPVTVDLAFPPDGHGTAMAGLIGAVTDNGMGVAGLNWNVRILPIRCGVGVGCDATTLALALGYAASMGALVANVSIAGVRDLAGMDEAVVIASDRLAILGAATAFFADPASMLLVWAAPSGKFLELVPIDCDAPRQYCAWAEAFAGEPNAVTVGASTWADGYVDLVASGPMTLHLAAPGGEGMLLLSSSGGVYTPFLGGSSAATALTSGAGGLLMAHDPVLRAMPDPARVKTAILEGADTPSLLGGVEGGRRLNVAGALSSL